MRSRLDHLPSGYTKVEKRTTCDRCQRSPMRWNYLTNGDGSTVQECPGCGTCYAIGVWFSSTELGIRLPARSVWSALVTPSTKSVA